MKRAIFCTHQWNALAARGKKNRPLLVILDTGDSDIVVSRITGHPSRDAYDVRITDLETVGLPGDSTVRISMIATIPREQVVKRLGCLSEFDRKAVQAVFHRIAEAFEEDGIHPT